jgi:indole-3-glycerol phosphate synthase
MFLERIVASKKLEIEQLYFRFSESEWEKAEKLPPGLSLSRAIAGSRGLSVIAEVKPASPSKGVIRAEVDAVQVAAGYEKGGAAAISILTDTPFFGGKPESLMAVKQVIQIPVLRKDFIMDPIQVLESKLLGADAILLIVALLDESRLRQLSETAHRLGMEVLVEVHEEREIPLAESCQADVIGINNRNLHTFVTDLATTERLRSQVTVPVPVIGESGVHSAEDVKRMLAAGVDGILVGEYLMRQSDPQRAVEALLEGVST